MTDKSKCMKCMQLTRIWIKQGENEFDEEKRICRAEEITDILLPEDTITECSQFILEREV